MGAGLTIACVLKSGGVYTPEWAAKLLDGIVIDQPFRFVCLTDKFMGCRALGVPTKPLEYDLPGWWSKLELFRPSMFRHGGPVLYLDLDSIVTAPLDPLLRTYRKGSFSMVPDYLLAGRGMMNSSVMLWDSSRDFSFLFKNFRSAMQRNIGIYDKVRPGGRIGDQAYIEDQLHAHKCKISPFDATEIVSYKLKAKHGPPEGARVVSFHGNPKQPMATGWPMQYWQGGLNFHGG